MELVATLDRPDALTCEVLYDFGADGFDGWTAATVDHGSLGPTRNDGIARARGAYLSTCDGDDLISYNSVVAMLRLAEEMGPEAVIFPQYVYGFGDEYHCAEYFPLEQITALPFLETHPYVSRAFARRCLFLSIPYADAAPSSGYAYEDWHFNAECAAHKKTLSVAENTILFYRRRGGSLLHQSDEATSRQIPPCSLFDPITWVKCTEEAYRSLHSLQERRTDGPNLSDAIEPPEFHDFLRAANAIEPAIQPWRFRGVPRFTNISTPSLAIGLAYHEICRIVGPLCFDEVFVLPFITKGGADRYASDIMGALWRAAPTRQILVLLGESLPNGSFIDRVPPNATVLDLGNDWPELTRGQRELIALKLIQACAPRARLHLRPSWFADEFYDRFYSVLSHNPTVLYRFSDTKKIYMGGAWICDSGFGFVSRHIRHLQMIVTDNDCIARNDYQRVGAFVEKWQLLPSRNPPRVTREDAASRAASLRGRVLWASRLDSEKRPDLLPLIAQFLAARTLAVRVDVFGSAVLGGFDVRCLTGLPNLAYCGPFDGLTSLDYRAYDVFVYTSLFDGLPNIILEAMAVGLPVIAPDVGGIAEAVIAGVTGILVPDKVDPKETAAAYAEAIIRLIDTPPLRRALATNALERLIEQHGEGAYETTVRRVFELAHGERPPEDGLRSENAADARVASTR